MIYFTITLHSPNSILPIPDSNAPRTIECSPPLHSPTVAHPLLSSSYCVRVNLVGCCMHSLIGGRLKQRQISLHLYFFASKSDGRKEFMASSPIVIALRAASPIYTLPMRSVFGWLLRHPKQQEPSKSKSPPPSLFYFFLCSICHPKRWANGLPHAFHPSAYPLHRPSHRRHHRSVGCCVKQLSSGHSRPVLRPSLIFLMSAL